jgi:DNA repair exonuclease SbcCD ATPase subunit
LLNSKEKVDTTISSLNPSKLEEEMEAIKLKGSEHKTKIDEYNTKIDEIGKIEFDEDRLHIATGELNNLTTEIGIADGKIAALQTNIEVLKSSEICPSCDRPLEGIDNSGKIKEAEDEILRVKSANEVKGRKKDKLNEEINGLNDIKKQVDAKNALELQRDRAEVEVGSLRNQYTEKQNELKKYKLNLEAIELNRKVDSDVEVINSKLQICNHTNDQLVIAQQTATNNITNNENDIKTKSEIIETIKKEEDIDKIFKVYTEMVGKKGISKLVLRSVLPILNSEIQRLLEDVTDFEVEVFMDDKNDVRFLLVKDDIEKLLKSGSGFERTASSLALRCVLGKMSTLPMPNFITFDEVLGRVANENIEKMKPLFDKIKDMYDIVFFITHNELVKDWADNIITIEKDNNISKILMK